MSKSRTLAAGLLPVYHEVVPGGSPYVYSIDSSRLAEHFAMIATLRDNIGASMPPITFDDGHISHFQHAFPFLQQQRLRGLFFVVAGWIGQRAERMNWQQLAQLAASGHEVQSHGWSHVALTHCSAVELDRELVLSRETLEQKLGIRVDAISLPYGRWNHRVLAGCEQAGYLRVYLSEPWTGGSAWQHLTLFGRFSVLRSTDAERLRRVLTGDPALLRALRTRHACKRLLRALVGDLNYHRLWRLVGRRDELDGYPPEFAARAGRP